MLKNSSAIGSVKGLVNTQQNEKYQKSAQWNAQNMLSNTFSKRHNDMQSNQNKTQESQQ